MLRGERQSRRGWGKAQGKERRGLWRGECMWRGEESNRGKRQGRGGRCPARVFYTVVVEFCFTLQYST